MNARPGHGRVGNQQSLHSLATRKGCFWYDSRVKPRYGIYSNRIPFLAGLSRTTIQDKMIGVYMNQVLACLRRPRARRGTLSGLPVVFVARSPSTGQLPLRRADGKRAGFELYFDMAHDACHIYIVARTPLRNHSGWLRPPKPRPRLGSGRIYNAVHLPSPGIPKRLSSSRACSGRLFRKLMSRCLIKSSAKESWFDHLPAPRQ